MRSLVRFSGAMGIAGLLAAAGASLAPQAPAARPPAAADATRGIVTAAEAVVASLDEAGRAKIQFPFDSPQKTRWSNLPTGIYERQGVRLGDLSNAQRETVKALLRTALSPDGYRKVTEIMLGDEILRTNGGGRGAPPRGGAPPQAAPGAGGPPPAGARAGNPGAGSAPQAQGQGQGQGGGARGGRGGPGGVIFGEDEYYLAFVGRPSTTTPWMLQFGGHHLAINLTLAGSDASMAPSLPAAQPATYTFEGREIRPLGREQDKAFALINALTEEQRSKAVIGARVADLVLGPGQDGRVIQPEGLPASALPPAQQQALLEIVREWVGIMHDAFAAPRMADIRARLPETYFAWSGPTTPGSAAYFRIQGPTLVIEYAPQGSVDHIHTIYRDPTNDYGAKIAK